MRPFFNSRRIPTTRTHFFFPLLLLTCSYYVSNSRGNGAPWVHTNMGPDNGTSRMLNLVIPLESRSAIRSALPSNLGCAVLGKYLTYLLMCVNR
ncbi:hypothetical protein F4809DRAFT_534393 [Biscogniauxia mediterranea]|nr:hypothetical protein F4809DRAFT_534393 [Biscogniauxia mediterranea]